MTIDSLEPLADDYRRTTSELELAIAERDQAKQRASDQFASRIDAATSAAAAARMRLLSAIETNRGLFREPKTFTYASSGVTVGFRKVRDCYVIEDQARAVAAAGKFPAHVREHLLQTEVSIRRGFLSRLDEKLLSRLGCRVVEGIDQPIAEA